MFPALAGGFFGLPRWLNSSQVVKNSLASTGDERDVDSIPRSGKSPAVGNGNPL